MVDVSSFHFSCLTNGEVVFFLAVAFPFDENRKLYVNITWNNFEEKRLLQKKKEK